ncbi:MAG: lytic transglycosylase domain-containing protein [Stellaceae bacterium]
MPRAGEIRLPRAAAGVVCLAAIGLVLLAAPGGAAPVRLVAGGAARFAPVRRRALDRIAAAVDGAESSYGANPAMWRLDPLGPQGPMQVSAAAAADVGGGDRFDIDENLALGRAYLARMYHHYGSWADAVAAYNWGPARMDAWIRSGRPAARLPAAVERYTGRVLLASSTSAAGGLATPNLPALNFAQRRPGLRPLRRLHRVRRINPRDPVQELYSRLMQASADAR